MHASYRVRALLLTLCIANLAAGCSQIQTVDSGEELHISKVVLYQNGIGYFERRGTIDGDRLDLRVRPDQINDVLKSLAVLDFSGGQTSSVALPVERSSSRLARELPRQVRNARGLVGMLRVLRGVQVSVDTDDRDFDGRVVGVEKGEKGRKVLTLMTGRRKLRTIRLAKIKQVKIHDKALAVGLSRSLDISKRDGRWKPVSLTVRLAGGEAHDLLISYIHEVPIWRPAYRAWVDTKGKVQLQGWAIVDNVSGEDWKNVQLSLVVGSPLSFRYDLHRTHWVNRPSLSHRMPQVAAAPPPPDVGYEESDDAAPKEMKVRSRISGMGGGSAGRSYRARPRRKSFKKRSAPKPRAAPYPATRGAYGSGPSAFADVSVERRRSAMMRSAAALVKGKKVGALYKYDALTPITVPDGKAALINIVNRKVGGRDVFLFRRPSGAPFRAVLIRNAKGSALESGPITLYVGGTFAGEGFLGRIEKDATTFIPYAQEGGFKIHQRFTSKTSQAKLVKIVDGRIHIEARTTYTRTLTIRSQRDKPSLAYVKLRRRNGTKLHEPPEDIVKAGNDLYVPVKVPAKGEGKATIVERRDIKRSTIYLDSLAITALKLFVQDQSASDALKGPVRELLVVHKQQAQLGRARSTLYRQRNLLNNEARRIRRNLDSLPLAKVANKLRKQLVAQLKGNSENAAKVAKDLVDNEVKRAALKEKLVTLLRSINLK